MGVKLTYLLFFVVAEDHQYTGQDLQAVRADDVHACFQARLFFQIKTTPQLSDLWVGIPQSPRGAAFFVTWRILDCGMVCINHQLTGGRGHYIIGSIVRRSNLKKTFNPICQLPRVYSIFFLFKSHYRKQGCLEGTRLPLKDRPVIKVKLAKEGSVGAN